MHVKPIIIISARHESGWRDGGLDDKFDHGPMDSRNIDIGNMENYIKYYLHLSCQVHHVPQR